MTHINMEQLQIEATQLLREFLPLKDTLKPKQRREIPVQEMPTVSPEIRVKNLEEVAIGYTEEQARVEALRCIQCKNKACMKGCPVQIDIPEFIKHVADGEFKKAADTIKESSLLPGICGRVCPQETQCQLYCTVGKAMKDVDKSVAIGRLERFVADWERTNNEVTVPEIKPETGKKVAVIGTGPAGLAAASDIRKEGHSVTMFEALHKTGGVLRYGIPEFRLPNDLVDSDIDNLIKMGVEVKTNYVVGSTRKLKDLMAKDHFDAVFIGSGAGLPNFAGIEGENKVGVFSANEYLTRANLMRAFDKKNADTPMYHSKNAIIMGGGNVAMDAARMAKRMGAEHTYVIYRRTEAEMPARNEEIEHAKEEGIEFLFLQNIKRIIGDGEGRVSAVECVRFELGEPDDSGRRRPVEVKDSEFTMEMDTVIIAIGNSSNPLIPQTTEKLDVNKWGNIVVDESGQTSIPGVYAGGDIVLGAATVILAMGEGRRSAASINKYLESK